jgi:hypothetical protein
VIINELAQQELQRWNEARQNILSIGKVDIEAGGTTEEQLDVLRALFQIADDLSDIVVRTIDIPHGITPDIVGVLSAVIFGITRGEVFPEIEQILELKQRSDEINKDRPKH